MKMYGLFQYSYDYYEWRDLQCVSAKMSHLKKEYKKNKKDVYGGKLVTAADHERILNDRTEELHYTIEEIKVV